MSRQPKIWHRSLFETLKDVYEGVYGDKLVLKSIRIYETPNCWAEVTAGPVNDR